jgi:hypothetical protein
LVNLLLTFEGGALRRNFASGLAMFAALLFLAFPALAQESLGQPSTSPVAVAPPQQDKPAEHPSTQNNRQGQNGPVQQGQNSQTEKEKSKDDRMFFVMPNFLTVGNEAQVAPISWKEKFSITAKGAFDPYEFITVGVLAGIRQAENAYPAFGQGMEGYAKRYGASFADQVDGNFMVGAVYPSILKTDPRYFQLGKGGFAHRFGYAFTRIFVTRRDSGGHMFNIPEFAGNATAIAISNLYYPAADRGFSQSANNWGVQMAIDAFGNELKEFWPDIHRRFSRNKSSAQSAQ